MQTPFSTTSQVIIAGAGPVGLMLAAELRLAGINVLVVEQRPAGTIGESRAPGINARTMEIFAQRGLADEFRSRGKELPFVVFAAIPMDPRSVDPDWPAALILPQHETERILLARAEELGARIRWSAAATRVEQDGDGVTLQIETTTGTETVRGTFLVGCDGGRSTIRTSSAIPFPGLAPQTWWVVGDLDLAEPPSAGGAFGNNDRVGYYQVSQTEPNWYRLSLMRQTPPDDPAQPVTLDEIRQTMIEGLGTDHGLRGARWMSRWSDGFHHAERYRDRRVFLAGDAAHTHTPIGGQGLNVGIQDAVNLGWKLAAVLNRDAPDALLDTYHHERWPIAAAALKQSMAQTELVKPGPRRAAIRDVFDSLLTNPTTVLQLSSELSGLGLRYPFGEGHPLLGRRLPNLTLLDARTSDAHASDETGPGTTNVFTLLRDGRPLLLDLTGTQTAQALTTHQERVQVVTARYLPQRRDDLWHLPVFGDVAPFDAALVRPDGYVAWIKPAAEPLDADALSAALGYHRTDTPIEQATERAGTSPAAGTWDITFTTPSGEQHAELVLRTNGTQWDGTYNHDPLIEAAVRDHTVAFTCKLKSPFPVRVRWIGEIDGNTMSGEAKASFMALPFTATRRL